MVAAAFFLWEKRPRRTRETVQPPPPRWRVFAETTAVFLGGQGVSGWVCRWRRGYALGVRESIGRLRIGILRQIRDLSIFGEWGGVDTAHLSLSSLFSRSCGVQGAGLV